VTHLVSALARLLPCSSDAKNVRGCLQQFPLFNVQAAHPPKTRLHARGNDGEYGDFGLREFLEANRPSVTRASEARDVNPPYLSKIRIVSTTGFNESLRNR
jgi:hypothetical protein